MTRDEYLTVLATEPATGTQVGAIVGEFARLGVVDRGERLAITAGLLGLEELSSTSDLVMGDAGRLVAMLRRTRDRAELPDVAAAADDEDQADEHDSGNLADDGHDGNEPVTLAGAIVRIIALFYAVYQENASASKSAGYPADNIMPISREQAL